MKLSILIVSYNQENYIKKAIEGILIQQLPFDYEIILADDNSQDQTVAVAKELLKNQPLKVLESAENLGISKNYKRGFAACNGEYIAVLEGDDYWVHPSRLMQHLTFLDNHHECVLSMNNLIKLNDNQDKFFIQPWIYQNDYQYFTTSDLAKGNKLGNLSACVFRNAEIQKINPAFYDLNIADWLLSIVLSKNGFVVVFKEATSVYRVHQKGEWSKLNRKKQLQHTFDNIDHYNKFLNYQYHREFKICKKELNPSWLYRLQKINYTDYIPPIINLFIPNIVHKLLKKI